MAVTRVGKKSKGIFFCQEEGNQGIKYLSTFPPRKTELSSIMTILYHHIPPKTSPTYTSKPQQPVHLRRTTTKKQSTALLPFATRTPPSPPPCPCPRPPLRRRGGFLVLVLLEGGHNVCRQRNVRIFRVPRVQDLLVIFEAGERCLPVSWSSLPIPLTLSGVFLRVISTTDGIVAFRARISLFILR